MIELGGSPESPPALASLGPTALVEALVPALGSDDPISLLREIERAVRTARGSWPVVELVAELPPDPRIGRLALALLRDFTDLPHTSTKLWRRLLETVQRHGDPSCIPPLQALQPQDGTASSRSRLSNIIKRLAKAKRLTDHEIQQLDDERVVASTTGPELLAAVYADPSSDAAREIYADYLLGIGDPRGELIQLQLQRAAGRATDAGMKRELSLLKKHAKTWAGPLAQIITHTQPTEYGTAELPVPGMHGLTFARGFVARMPALRIRSHRESVLDDPLWSTVEHVWFVPRITAVMRALQSVRLARLELLAEPRTFEQLTFQAYELTKARGRPEVFLGCRVKHLALQLNTSSEGIVEILEAATRDNPTLVEISMSGGPGNRAELVWGWRDLAMPYVETVSYSFGAARLAVRMKDDHLDITSNVDQTPYWRTVLEPLRGRPFASVRITNAGDRYGRAVDTIARELHIAK